MKKIVSKNQDHHKYVFSSIFLLLLFVTSSFRLRKDLHKNRSDAGLICSTTHKLTYSPSSVQTAKESPLERRVWKKRRLRLLCLSFFWLSFFNVANDGQFYIFRLFFLFFFMHKKPQVSGHLIQVWKRTTIFSSLLTLFCAHNEPRVLNQRTRLPSRR